VKARVPLLAVVFLSAVSLAGEGQFRRKPAAKKAGEQLEVSFAVAGKTDVEVAILDLWAR